MDNIVIDTNCLIMSISSRSSYNKIWQSFLAGEFTLCISNEILEEDGLDNVGLYLADAPHHISLPIFTGYV